jgi:hypothetical protein
VKRELDILAGLLLEGGDDILDRLVLVRVVALVLPHHEVGGLRAASEIEPQRG